VAKLPAEEADELLDRADPQTNESGTPMRRDAFRVMVRNHNLRHGNVTVESRPVSVIESDAEALVTLIGLHAPPQPRILDVTYNTGAMWNGTPFGPTRMDINPTFKDMGLCDITADCRAMPFDDESYEVIVFDPPHITDAGSDSVMGQRYGSLEGDNISEIFQPFLQEAHRVLTPDGIVLVKICDAVHAGRHQWQHVDLLEDAWALDFTACDVQIKVNRHDPVEGNWLTVRHVRNAHAFWIVLRKGDNCDRGGFDVAQSRQPPTVLP
jgi:SAM-dependent methyltransferase